jgi:tetratricopeptide (TPR) repeat protein
LLELALMAEEQNDLTKAQQVFAQYLQRWPTDPSGPEILLRQGLLYRRMGTPTLALAKFYAVMTSALTLKYGSVEYYQRLVLHAQTEIADTYYLQGKHEETIEFFQRLLKQGSPELNRRQVQFKLVRSFAALGRHTETIAQAQDYLERHPQSAEEPELRFLMAAAFKALQQAADARQQVLRLLQAPPAAGATPEADRTNRVYWQQRAGNEIANQLYLEGDYVNALEIYTTLAALDTAPAWQLPAWYQMGLIYEKLQQPRRAADTYSRIAAREKELASRATPGLKALLDMARWRTDFLNWHAQAEHASRTNLPAAAVSPAAVH